MRSCHTLDQLDTGFNDTHAVANAGLLLPATLVGDYATLADDLEVTLSHGQIGQCWTTRRPSRSSHP
jgi:hypothetical protein